ncbi:MAG: PAS domain S-box protein, partial [Deltaproteobacteria bacterium]|nr:PAS domain S-box protein [Deltaproteobacteria bacterium]
LAMSLFQRILNEKASLTHELRILTQSGEYRVGEFLGTPKIETNSVVSFLGIVRDITERKKAEEALAQSEERYRTILENIEDGYYEVDIAGNVTFFNDSFCRLFGYSKDEMMGMNNRQYTDEENAKKLYQAFNKVYRTRQPTQAFDLSVMRKDGTKIFGEVSVSLMTDSKGQPIGFRGIARDITERRRTEEALQDSLERFRQVADSAGEWIWEINADGLYTYTSPGVEEILGYKIEEIVGKKHFYDFFPPEVREELKKAAFESLAKKQPFRNFMNPNVTKKGNIVLLETNGAPILDNNGTLLGYRGADTNITERKQAEEALRESEERYRTLVEESFDGIFIQKGFGIIFANRRLYEMLGYAKGELEGLDHWLIYHPDYQDLTRERAQARLRGEAAPSTYEVKFLRKDGSSFWGEINAKAISYLGEPGVQVWARDISERKQAEETLRAERERFRSLSENAPFGMAMIDKNGAFKYINPKLKELFGYDLNDIPDGKTWFRKAYPDPDYRHQVISEWLDDLKSFKSGEKRARIFTVTCKDGAQKIINFIPVQLETSENMMACEDITERKHAEEALRESGERYRTILENIEDGYYEVDLPGNFTFFNDSLCRILGYSRDEMIGMGNQQYTDEENRKKLFQAFNKVYKTGKSIKGFDWKVFRKDGTKLFGEVSVSLIKDSKGQSIGFRGIARDITERKQAEEVLRRSEESSRELAQENATMAEIGWIISSTLNIDEVYERFSEELNKLI